ncbi:MAG: hypothetical protein R3233_12140, partial [Xanthomonadales bacterium]|nr:hypothetical protein [Xanthomonadales bacterium]
MTRCYLLDIDGTMMPSAAVDNRCYWQAVAAVFGGGDQPRDLGGFRHVTDIGILEEWCQEIHQRKPTANEVDGVRRQFLEFLSDARERDASWLAPTPGLTDWLERQRRDRHALAFATGGWGHTARAKLAWTPIRADGLPLVTCDDAPTRTAIMAAARERVAPAGDGVQADVVYIGDGAWDESAARKLGWRFVGIGTAPAGARNP